MNNKLSIITVNKDNDKGLVRTIKSVVKQSKNAFEYLIIDGSSIDDSVSIIKQNMNNITYWISEKDGGIYNAMNKGIKKATGDYYMFLNSGDELFNTNTIQNCMNAIINNPDVDVFYGNIFLVNSALEAQNNTIKRMPEALDINFFRHDTLNHQASLIRAELFEEFGLYPENYRLASDYWLYLKSMVADKIFYHLDFALVKYDLSGISANAYGKYQAEMKSVWESVLPKIVRDLVTENEKLRKLTQYKLVKMAVRLNDFYQKSKSIS